MRIQVKRGRNSHMSMADRIKENAEQKKMERTSEQRLRDTFNNASLTLINQFMAKVMAGSIDIDDVGDLTRLFQIYMQINNINAGMQEGTGQLPALSATQKDIIADKVSTEKATIDGEEEEVVSLEELAKLSDEEIDKMLLDKEIQMNKENEATF
ncbi:hypothetical protein [Enterococcus phage EFGrNG]|uniref:Terminase small subunit n=19 Tax=Schiekvirus TaxID=2732968 RepID=A0A7S9XHU8_9CAUD|nr:hypothetical protein [Enterococcus phage EFGrNG]